MKKMRKTGTHLAASAKKAAHSRSRHPRRTAVISAALVLVMIVSLVLGSFTTAYADEAGHDTEADGSTMSSWVTEMSAYDTSQVGRIWTDKSVFDDSYSFANATYPEGVDSALKDETIEIGDSDFLVALSALSSTSNITYEEADASATPLDIVLVLDLSSSVNSNNVTTYTYTYTEAYDVNTTNTYYVSVGSSYYAVSYGAVYTAVSNTSSMATSGTTYYILQNGSYTAVSYASSAISNVYTVADTSSIETPSVNNNSYETTDYYIYVNNNWQQLTYYNNYQVNGGQGGNATYTGWYYTTTNGGPTTYTAVTLGNQTVYQSGSTVSANSWYYTATVGNETVYYVMDSDTTYYTASDSDVWSYTASDGSSVVVTPLTSAEDTTSGSVQFYTRTQTGSTTQTRMEAIKEAVNNFLDLVAAHNDEVVTAYTNVGKSTDEIEAALVEVSIITYNATDYSPSTETNLTAYTTEAQTRDSNTSSSSGEGSAYTTAVSTGKATVTALGYNTGTRSDLGLYGAVDQLQRNDRSDADNIVIHFTDGIPSTSGDTQFNFSYAAAAVEYAYTLKTTYGNL